MKKIVLNILLLVVVIGFLGYVIRQLRNDARNPIALTEEGVEEVSRFASVAQYETSDPIIRTRTTQEGYAVATTQSIYLLSKELAPVREIKVRSGMRDFLITHRGVVALYPTSIRIYEPNGTVAQEWEACDDQADYCALAAVGREWWVTDAGNKAIAVYDEGGRFRRMLHSPVGFVIPSRSFDITTQGNTVWVVNSGRHLIESYSADGTYLSAWGGGKEASFYGCCNPTYITVTEEGNVITSEKGRPRITLYTASGELRCVLLQSTEAAAATTPYSILSDAHRMLIARDRSVQLVQVNTQRNSGCEGCPAACHTKR